MKNTIKHTTIFFLSAIMLSSCTKEVLRGEGTITTETRMFNAFTAVEISGDREAEIIFSSESKVEISGYENLIAAYSSRVSNGKLYFDFPNACVVKNDNIRLKIFTPQLSKIVISGSGTVATGEGFTGQVFEGLLSGDALLTIGTGQYDKVRYTISGSGQILAEPLAAKTATVFISGSGKVEVRASQTLDATISGSGMVHFWGNPAVTSHISGDGKLVKH
jgi:hypothetical protein